MRTMADLIYEKRGPIALLTLNRPEKLNAMDHALQNTLGEAWEDFESDDALRVAVITGAGDRAFSAGADLITAAPAYVDPSRRPQKLKSFVPDSRKPIIAAIHGHCLAGALALVLRCDIRVATPEARIGGTGAKLGLFPAGQCVRLARLVPPSRALWMLLQAEPLSGRQAYDSGLVDELVPRERLLARALEIAERIAANAPIVVRQIKDAVYQGMSLTLEQAMQLEGKYFRESGATEDGREGLAAWAERRAPRFRGR